MLSLLVSQIGQGAGTAITNGGLFEVDVNFEMWVGNVLLVGINVSPVDTDPIDGQLSVSMRVETDVCHVV